MLIQMRQAVYVRRRFLFLDELIVPPLKKLFLVRILIYPYRFVCGHSLILTRQVDLLTLSSSFLITLPYILFICLFMLETTNLYLVILFLSSHNFIFSIHIHYMIVIHFNFFY